MLLDLSITSSTFAALKVASTDVTPHSSRPTKRSQLETLRPAIWPASPAISPAPPLLALPPLPKLRSTPGPSAVPPLAFSATAPSSLLLHPPLRASKSAESPILGTLLIFAHGLSSRRIASNR